MTHALRSSLIGRCFTFWFVSAFLLCAVSDAAANSASIIPSYYTQLRYNLTGPGTPESAVGGFANPAVYGVLPGGEVLFAWSDHDNSFRSLEEWGLFLAGPTLGFGVVRSLEPLPLGLGHAGVNDLRLGFAVGDRNTSLGIGYGWSTGHDDAVGRSQLVQLGMVQRFGRYISLGAVGSFATEKSYQQGLFDVGIRPLGSRRLTLFADLELAKGMAFEDAPWSAGAMFEAVPGVQLIGRYFEDESYAISVGFSFGAAAVSASPRYDKNNNVTGTIYGVRTGFYERNVIDTYIERNKSYLSMNLKGNVQYRSYKFFDKDTRTLADILNALDEAIKDPRISGVALNLSGVKVSRGKAWEIRRKLKEVQQSGKRVVVFIDDAGMTEYHLASVADRVVLDQEGLILLPGYLMGRTFYKGMLEKMGIAFDEWRFFTYKSAAEALSRESMSDPDREQRLEIVEDTYETVRKETASARKVSEETFDNWVNHMMFNAERALESGLVDKLGRWEDVKDVIKDLEGSKKGYFAANNLIGIKAPSTRWGERPRIALVYALGPCRMDEGIRARQLEKVFQKLRDDRSVKAVVFRVDSPGGEIVASDVTADALRKCAEKKPVIVSQGDVAGSGGYWISMYGTEVYALPTTITGSIGVIGGWLWDNGMADKLGLGSDFVKIGDHADLGFGVTLPLIGVTVPDRNLDDNERTEIEKEFMHAYDGFVDRVAKGREMTPDQVHRLAQGRVYSGVAGIRVGLVDRIGGLDDAIRAAKAAAGLAPDEEVSIDEYPELPLFNLAFLRTRFPMWTGLQTEPKIETETDESIDWTYIRMLAGKPGRPLGLIPPEDLVREARLGL